MATLTANALLYYVDTLFCPLTLLLSRRRPTSQRPFVDRGKKGRRKSPLGNVNNNNNCSQEPHRKKSLLLLQEQLSDTTKVGKFLLSLSHAILSFSSERKEEGERRREREKGSSFCFTPPHRICALQVTVAILTLCGT